MTNLINQFKNTLNTHAPFRNLSRRKKKLRTKPWLSKGLLISIRYKNKLFSRCLSKKREKKLKLWEYFKKYRNKPTHLNTSNNKQKSYIIKMQSLIINKTQLNYEKLLMKYYTTKTKSPIKFHRKYLSMVFQYMIQSQSVVYLMNILLILVIL